MQNKTIEKLKAAKFIEFEFCADWMYLSVNAETQLEMREALSVINQVIADYDCNTMPSPSEIEDFNTQMQERKIFLAMRQKLLSNIQVRSN